MCFSGIEIFVKNPPSLVRKIDDLNPANKNNILVAAIDAASDRDGIRPLCGSV